MIRTLSVFFLFTLMFSALAQEESSPLAEASDAEKQYIIDDLFIYMHAGPGREYRIVGSINAGTAVDVLQVDNETDYTEVEDERGRSGWVESRFLTEQVSLRQQIPQLQTQLDDQSALILSREGEISRLEQQLSSLQDVEAQLRQQISDLQTENTQISAKLQENNKAEYLDWFVKGGGVALGGVLLGLIISSIFKRRKRDQWM